MSDDKLTEEENKLHMALGKKKLPFGLVNKPPGLWNDELAIIAFENIWKHQNPKYVKSIFPKLFWGSWKWTKINVQNWKTKKSFAKKKFFLIVTNRKLYLRKWERLVGKSLFCTIVHFFANSDRSCPKKPQFCILQNFFWFFFRAEKNDTIKAKVIRKVLGVF